MTQKHTPKLSDKEMDRIVNALDFQERMGGGFGHLAHGCNSTLTIERINNRRLIKKLEASYA